MAEQHTPGPWHAEHNRTVFAKHTRYRNRPKKICRVGSDSYRAPAHSIEDAANARLIAAAPAMLAALRKLCNEINALRASNFALREAIGNTNYAVLVQRADEARAAIAAATGETGEKND